MSLFTIRRGPPYAKSRDRGRFAWDGADYRTGASLLEVNKWEAARIALHLADRVGYHPYPFDELMLMIAAFQYHRPRLVIDIGTHLGKSARVWWELSRLFDTSSEIHTIDLCDPSHPECPGKELGKFIRKMPVQQHVGDGAAVAESLLRSCNGRETLLFLDGDHHQETVARELKLSRYVPKGCLIVHDTFYQPSSGYHHGPFLAVKAFLAEGRHGHFVHLQTGLPGMTYIEVGHNLNPLNSEKVL